MPGLLGNTPATPQVMVSPAMPDPQSPSVVEASNNAAISATKRQGRQSTVIGKQAAQPTIADTYSGSKLGATS